MFIFHCFLTNVKSFTQDNDGIFKIHKKESTAKNIAFTDPHKGFRIQRVSRL